MPPEDINKLNRLEELKGRLFGRNYQTKVEHRDRYSHTNKREVVDDWQNKEKPEENGAEKFFMKTSRFKKFFIFSVVFFALTLGYAAYMFFAGGNTVSNDNIDISILGNNFTGGGEELPLIVGITNKNNASLDLVDLVVEYLKGSRADKSNNTERLRVSLGTIPAGAVRNENIKVTLFGEQGSTTTIKVSIEYRVVGSNAIFVKEKDYKVNVSSTPINLSVDAPSAVSPNQDITLKIKATLNATKPASRVLVKLIYPTGFTFGSAAPSPSFGNNVWNLGDLAPGVERDISISGKMVGVFDGEEKTFQISTGSQSASDKSVIDVVYNSIAQIIAVKKAFVEANLFINGVSQSEYATDWKTAVNAEIRYTNNLNTRVDNLQIRAKISGNAFAANGVTAQQGFYDSSKSTITWDKNSDNQLSELNPGDTGSVAFSIAPLPLYSGGGAILASPSINIEVSVTGSEAIEGSAGSTINNTSSAVVRIISDVGFSAKALYYSGPFKNTGPIPPKAEQKTTYTITWALSNTANTISNAQIRSTIPAWMNFAGTISPQGENLIYNSSTKEIIWNVDKIGRGTGITGAPRSVSFQVSLSPSVSQVGTFPMIINEAVLTGHDDFAKVNVRVIKAGLTTRLDNDPAFPDGGSVVVQ